MSEHTEKPGTQDIHQKLDDTLYRLGHTNKLYESLRAARLVLDTIKASVDYAPHEEAAPDGHVFNIRPHHRSGKLTKGIYLAPHPAHGAGANVGNPREVEMAEGEVFVADRLVVSGDEILAVDTEQGVACEIPKPPFMYVNIVPVEPTEHSS